MSILNEILQKTKEGEKHTAEWDSLRSYFPGPRGFENLKDWAVINLITVTAADNNEDEVSGPIEFGPLQG